MTEKEAIMKDVVDYIELTDSVIGELSKRPSLQKSAIDKTAAALVKAGVVGKEAAAAVGKSIEDDPNRALEILEKVAGMVPASVRSSDFTLGSSAEVGGVKTSKLKEADRAFMTRLGLI